MDASKDRLGSLDFYLHQATVRDPNTVTQVVQEKAKQRLGTAYWAAISLLSHPLPSFPTVSVDPDFHLTGAPPSPAWIASEEAK